MEMDYAAMGKRIRDLRIRVGMTQKEFAEKVGISTSFLGHLERGTRIPSIETLVSLSDVLGISLDALVLGREYEREGMGGTRRARVLNDVMRVLNEHSQEWLRE